jgi:hypothetical protein
MDGPFQRFNLQNVANMSVKMMLGGVSSGYDS